MIAGDLTRKRPLHRILASAAKTTMGWFHSSGFSQQCAACRQTKRRFSSAIGHNLHLKSNSYRKQPRPLLAQAVVFGNSARTQFSLWLVG